jgi:multidrug resistance efflux pump
MSTRNATACVVASLSWLLALQPGFADEPKPGRIVLETKGYVVPVRQVTISAGVSGQVVDVAIEEGRRVNKGDILARLDPRKYEAALRLARAQLKAAEIKVVAAAAKGSAQLEQAEVEVAQARVAIAQHLLDGTVLRAPFSGTVLVKHAEVGTLLDPAGQQVGARLCDLADLQALEVEIWVQERDFEKAAKGLACTIKLEALPRATYRGVVSRILPVADRARGAVAMRVRLILPEGDDRARPEMGAIVQLLAKE